MVGTSATVSSLVRTWETQARSGATARITFGFDIFATADFYA
jgi:hypothetical protein